VTNIQKSTYSKQVPLDTLAQVGKIRPKKAKRDDLTPLQKRARAKSVTQATCTQLADYADTIGDKIMKKSFWSTWYCANELHQEGKKITGKYCNARWCFVCSRRRTAKAINRDLPIISQWSEPTFTTLTKKTISAEQLESEVNLRWSAFKRIEDKLGKRGFQFIGIIKLEINHSPNTNLFHPHFHILHDNHEIGKMIIDEWIKEFPNEASINAQDTTKADQNSLLEVYKYSVKLLSKNKRDVNIQALYHIYKILRGKKTIRRYKMPKIKDDNEECEMPELVAQTYNIEEENEIYLWQKYDWKGVTKNKYLTNYNPSENIKTILNTIEQCDNATTAITNLHLEMNKQNTVQRSAKRRHFISEKLPSIPPSNNPINPFLTREWINSVMNT